MRLAVIPARGGSKRIPRKNIREFCGKPIIAWSIEAAKKSGIFDKIIVSTDDEEVAEVAMSYGAEVPYLRPKELADDFTGTNDVVKHAIGYFLEQKRLELEYVCCLYATAPLLQAKDLISGYKALVHSKSSFAVSVTSFEFPIQRAVRISQDGLLEAVWPENIKMRSQDLDEVYHDAGQFYWGTPEAFLADAPIFSSNSVPIVLPRYRVQDIDVLEDWVRAELMFNVLIKAGEFR